MNEPQVRPEWLSRRLAAVYLSVSVKTIDRLARAGRIKRYNPDGDARYKRAELDEYMLGGRVDEPQSCGCL